MKKIIVISLAVILLLVGCQMSSKNITLKAIVTEVSENSLLVETIGYKDFDKASVGMNEKVKIVDEKGNAIRLQDIEINDELELTILPEVRESYPVQTTAVIVKRIKESENTDVLNLYRKITTQQAKEMIDQEDVIILDVRTQEEYNEKHIKNSILIPVDEIETKASTILKDKDKTILVYCRSGNRSATASQKLIVMGYTHVFDFGGINDWPYEVER